MMLRRWKICSACAIYLPTLTVRKVGRAFVGSETGNGVKIFIGTQTPLFSLSGSSLIISPYQDDSRSLVGVVGVIAPTRTDYAQLVPMVDHTAKLVSTLLSAQKEA